MLKIRRSRDRLVFNMRIPILGKDSLYIEIGTVDTDVRVLQQKGINWYSAEYAPMHFQMSMDQDTISWHLLS